MPPLLSSVLFFLYHVSPVSPQYSPTSPLFTELTLQANADLNATVVTQVDPLLISKYHPDKYLVPKNYYVYVPSVGYTQNVIFDPCRGQPFNCCNDTFGTPEYLSVASDPTQPSTYGTRRTTYADGTIIPPNAQRRPTDQIVIDETCKGALLPPGRTDCVTARIARVPWPSSPACWNWNASVAAGVGCRAPMDGSPLPLCLEVGYTQNAYIADCGGVWAGNDHCGTYLEVHRPGRVEKLGEVRLVGLATSGYRMTVLSTTYKKDPSKALCYDPVKKGQYELWWVVRAPDKFNVLKTMPFAVASPQCDWDPLRNRFWEFANITSTTAGGSGGTSNPYDPSLRLFTQPRIQTLVPSRPAKGMGSTIVVGNLSSDYPSGTAFNRLKFGVGDNSFTWRPNAPLFDSSQGVVSPSLQQQTFLAEQSEARGYRRGRRASTGLGGEEDPFMAEGEEGEDHPPSLFTEVPP